MTLFNLLLILALERVTVKPEKFHVTALSNLYFDFIENLKPLKKIGHSKRAQYLLVLIIASVPAIVILLITQELPGILVFILHLLILWICLGCPVTRSIYRRYIQAANREDLEACSIYSEKLGMESEELTKVGQRLVLVNYRQYASVIIFYVFLGISGVVFYSICKEWFVRCQKQQSINQINNAETAESINQNETNFNNKTETLSDITEDNSNLETDVEETAHSFDQSIAKKLLHILDWLPVRLTALGFLLVGHFSRGLPVWLSVVLDLNKPAYEVLSLVAKASEDPESYHKPILQEPLQMVKLVKRNIIFFLVAISIMTLVGLVG